jgi:hypothetical protein
MIVSKVRGSPPLFGEASRFVLEKVDIPGHGGFGHPGSFGMITWSEPDASGRRHSLCMAMFGSQRRSAPSG